MHTKVDELVALRMLIATSLPEQPAQGSTPLSRNFLEKFFPRGGKVNETKQAPGWGRSPQPVYGRAAKKEKH